MDYEQTQTPSMVQEVDEQREPLVTLNLQLQIDQNAISFPPTPQLQPQDSRLFRTPSFLELELALVPYAPTPAAPSALIISLPSVHVSSRVFKSTRYTSRADQGITLSRAHLALHAIGAVDIGEERKQLGRSFLVTPLHLPDADADTNPASNPIFEPDSELEPELDSDLDISKNSSDRASGFPSSCCSASKTHTRTRWASRALRPALPIRLGLTSRTGSSYGADHGHGLSPSLEFVSGLGLERSVSMESMTTAESSLSNLSTSQELVSFGTWSLDGSEGAEPGVEEMVLMGVELDDVLAGIGKSEEFLRPFKEQIQLQDGAHDASEKESANSVVFPAAISPSSSSRKRSRRKQSLQQPYVLSLSEMRGVTS